MRKTALKIATLVIVFVSVGLPQAQSLKESKLAILKQLRQSAWPERHKSLNELLTQPDLLKDNEISEELIDLLQRENRAVSEAAQAHAFGESFLGYYKLLIRLVQSLPDPRIAALVAEPVYFGHLEGAGVLAPVAALDQVIDLLKTGRPIQKTASMVVLNNLFVLSEKLLVIPTPPQKEEIKRHLLRLTDPAESVDVRAMAVASLANFPEPEVIAKLEEVAQTDPYHTTIDAKVRYLVRENAREALEKIRTRTRSN